MVKISVITVTYNAQATLEATILSVLEQTYPFIEFIIIDGKSTDNTVQIIKKYEQDIAFWLSEKDKGIYDAMNKGISKATGDKIIFLGADDVFYSKDVFSTLFNDPANDDVDMLYGDILLLNNKKIIGGERNYLSLLDKNIGHQAIFYKRSLFDKKGTFNTRYPVLADYHYNIQLFKDESVTKKYVPHIITLYNDWGTSNTNIDKNFYRDMAEQLKQEGLYGKTPSVQHYFFYNGFCDLDEGQSAKGLKQISYAVIHSDRKIFFFGLAVRFFFSFIGIGNKMTFK